MSIGWEEILASHVSDESLVPTVRKAAWKPQQEHDREPNERTGKGAEWTPLQGRSTNGQEVDEKRLGTVSHQELDIKWKPPKCS